MSKGKNKLDSVIDKLNAEVTPAVMPDEYDPFENANENEPVDSADAQAEEAVNTINPDEVPARADETSFEVLASCISPEYYKGDIVKGSEFGDRLAWLLETNALKAVD